MTLTDWLLLGWTIAALALMGATVHRNLVHDHDLACSMAAMYDRSAAEAIDARQALHDKMMAEAYHQKSIWPCATASADQVN